MTMNLLTIKNFSKSYTDKVLFSNADFSINTKEKIGVIGVNGTGKSTLLKIIAGIDTCDSGQFSKGNNVVIRYLPQTPDFTEAVSIYDYVITANSNEENQWSIEGDAKAFLHRLGFDDTSIMVNTLSGGQRKKLALVAALLTRPDLLILDEKHVGTIFAVRRLTETNLNVVVRLALEIDKNDYKNSVMTFYRLRDKNLKKLLEKNRLLYSRE